TGRCYVFFFFSSRRRHTRFSRDWSSDVSLPIYRLMPLHVAIFLEPGVAGAKYAMSRLGLISDRVRLPLVGLSDATKARIDAAMRSEERRVGKEGRAGW